jgi:hypothetical protein
MATRTPRDPATLARVPLRSTLAPEQVLAGLAASELW